eukprot:2779490-Rhodomonas_salina.1
MGQAMRRRIAHHALEKPAGVEALFEAGSTIPYLSTAHAVAPYPDSYQTRRSEGVGRSVPAAAIVGDGDALDLAQVEVCVREDILPSALEVDLTFVEQLEATAVGDRAVQRDEDLEGESEREERRRKGGGMEWNDRG